MFHFLFAAAIALGEPLTLDSPHRQAVPTLQHQNTTWSVKTRSTANIVGISPAYQTDDDDASGSSITGYTDNISASAQADNNLAECLGFARITNQNMSNGGKMEAAYRYHGTCTAATHTATTEIVAQVKCTSNYKVVGNPGGIYLAHGKFSINLVPATAADSMAQTFTQNYGQCKITGSWTGSQWEASGWYYDSEGQYQTINISGIGLIWSKDVYSPQLHNSTLEVTSNTNDHAGWESDGQTLSKAPNGTKVAVAHDRVSVQHIDFGGN